MFWSPLTRRIGHWLILLILVIGAGHLFLHLIEARLEARFGRHISR
ncbi:hypothetical protein ACQBAT_07000 [Ornithinimicrobium sp. Y1847]